MISRLPAIVVAVVSIVTLCAAAQAVDKKFIRIAHPAADDVDTDQQMFAWSFVNNMNTYSSTVEVKIFPTSELGKSRDAIEAKQVGSGASGTIGGISGYASFSRPVGVTALLKCPRSLATWPVRLSAFLLVQNTPLTA
ncbi:MAG: hypothetical protein OEM25_03220 [Gammaproteobacteria bacterium]|nr:hypothetical protein [Gammaproteobacteria bacterium]